MELPDPRQAVSHLETFDFDRNGKFRNFGILKSKLQKDNSVSKEEVRNL